MVDIVAIWLLLTSLLLADPSQKHFQVHQLDTASALGVILEVDRTPDGFTVMQGSDKVTIHKDPKKPTTYEVVLPGGDKTKVDMSALSVKQDEARIEDKDKHEALGLKMGTSWYVVLKGGTTVISLPGAAASKPAAK